MRRFILGLVSVAILSSSAVGQCVLKRQYPGSGPAPKSYCWDVNQITSAIYQQQFGGNATEIVNTKMTTTSNHGGGFITVAVDMFGYGNKPNVQMNYKNFVLTKTQNIINQYKIIVGTRYWFEGTDTKNLESGTLYVKDYSTIKDQLYVK